MNKKKIIPYIDDEFLDLLPRPNKEQRRIIRNSLIKNGLLEDITLDTGGMVVDGHTRFELCDELGIKKTYDIRKFKNFAEKIAFAISVNRDRRHLNTFQTFEAFEKEIDFIRKKNVTLRNQRIRKTMKKGKKSQTLKMKREHSTIKQAMNLTGLSETSISSSIFIKNNADNKMIGNVREGKIPLHKAVFELRVKLKIKANNNYRKEKAQYRSKIGIIMDITNTVRNQPNIIISELCRKANLSHYATKEYLKLLITSKIVKDNYTKKLTRRKREIISYTITTKGIEFHNSCKLIFDYLPKEFKL